MDKINVISGLLALAAGASLAIVYFGGLWLTVRRVAEQQRLSWLVPVSLLVRFALVLAAFYFLLVLDLRLMGLALLSFMVSRHWVVGRLGRYHKSQYNDSHGN